MASVIFEARIPITHQPDYTPFCPILNPFCHYCSFCVRTGLFYGSADSDGKEGGLTS